MSNEAKPTSGPSFEGAGAQIDKPDAFIAGQGLGGRVFYRVAWWILVPILRGYTRLTFSGKENLPSEGAYVIAPTHRCYLDTPFAGCIQQRRVRYMGKHTVWKNRQMGWILSALGGFPVQRGTADREAMRNSITVLEMGDPLVLFPEGERKQGPVVQPLFDGAVYIAIKAGVPIVPVGIGGSEKVMPKGAKFAYPRKVHLHIGPPIPPPVAPEGGRIPRKTYKEYTERLHTELQAAFEQSMTRVPWDYDADGQPG